MKDRVREGLGGSTWRNVVARVEQLFMHDLHAKFMCSFQDTLSFCVPFMTR